jgi:flagellar biosynthesis protein FliR
LNELILLLNQQDINKSILVFCRMGTALMFLPGFAIARVPVTIRAFLALTSSFSIVPFVNLNQTVRGTSSDFVSSILNEILVGAFFGFLCALFVYAVRVFAHTVMALIGLAGIPGQSIDDLEPNPALVVIFSMSFTALVFALDLHLMSFAALLETYRVYPLGNAPGSSITLEAIADTLRNTSLMAVQAASPFVLYGLGINFALGLVGKLTPQLQIYFALSGVSIMIALFGLYIIGATLLSFLISSYASWLSAGL